MSLSAISTFRGWRALRHRNFRLFISGQLVSLVGTWMQAVAQGWLVLTLTGDPFWLGVVAAAQFGPVLVLGLFGGLLADSLPKRRTLMITQTTAMVLAFTLFGLTATHAVEVWHIVVLALSLGIVNSVDMPTRHAFVVEMVGREDVGNAVALNSAVFNGARIVGPAIAGITIGATDISVAFLLNGLSFLAVIGAYVAMGESQLAASPRLARPSTVRGVFETLAEGLRYIRATPVVLLAIGVIGLVSTFGMNFTVLAPAIARDVLDVGASGYGFLMTSTGIGSFLVAMSIAFGRRSRPALIGLGAALLGVSWLVVAVSGSFALSLAAMFFVGVGGIGMAATANTTIQMAVPDQLRGRVMSVYTTVFAGSTPIGGLLVGSIASGFGVPAAVAVAGAGSVVAGLLGYVAWRRIRPPELPGADAPERAEKPVGVPVSAQAADTAATAAPEGARPSTAPG